MSINGARLEDSAFLAGIDDRDRKIWRFLGTVVGGLASGLVAGLVLGIVVFVVFILSTGVFNGLHSLDPVSLSARMQATLSGESMKSAILILMLAVSTNGPMALVFIFVACLLMRRRFRDYVTAAPKFRWRLLLLGLGLSFLIIGPVLAVLQLADPTSPRPPMLTLAHTLGMRAVYVLACVGLLIPAAAAEEVVFRGWMLKQSAVLTRNVWLLMLLNGALFSAVHGEFAPDAFITRTLMGAGFVYMTLRLGGIEFSIGANAANNIMIVLFLQPLSLKPPPSAGLGAGTILQDAFLFAAYVAMTELIARWAPLRRWAGVDLARGPASAEAEMFA